jgi:hypothetical protein
MDADILETDLIANRFISSDRSRVERVDPSQPL